MTGTSPTPPRADGVEIRRALAVIHGNVEHNIFEIRIPKSAKDGTISGYFDDFERAVKAILEVAGKGPGIYLTLNPIAPALLARAKNRLQLRATTTTADRDVIERVWLLIDVDPVRPAEISSSDEEHEAALAKAREIRGVLAEEGWPAPVLADSGNGGHLLYPIALPNGKEETSLLADVLKALAGRFDDEVVKVDRSVFNAGRISKIYGTVAGKGDHTVERPHRLARLLDVPNKLLNGRRDPVPRELLEALARSAAPATPPTPPTPITQPRPAPRRRFDLDDFLARYLRARAPVNHDGGRKWILEECPFNAEHKAPDAAIFESADGAIGFKCFHNSCSNYGWRDVREKFEPRQSGKKTNPRPPANALVDLNCFEATVALLNSLAIWGRRIEFVSVERKGAMLIATTSEQLEIVWPSIADLTLFGRSQAIIADATNIIIPTPPQRQIREQWEEAAALLLKLAAQDAIRLEPTLKAEIRDLIQLVWMAAGQPFAEDSGKFIEFMRQVEQTRRNPIGAVPPCVFIAEQAVWVHVPSLRLWASIPTLTNKQPALGDLRSGLLLLGFVYRENLSRGFEGDSESACLWEGPVEVLQS
jgi:hypothetical protein